MRAFSARTVRRRARFGPAARAFGLTLAGLLIAMGRPAAASDLKIATFEGCALRSGAIIQPCRIGYRTFGALNADRSNIVLFPTWYNGQSDEIDPLMGPDGLIDTGKFFVIAIDALGDGVSSSPSNGAGAQQGVGFPVLSIADMVEAEHRLAVTVFGAAHVHAVVGISMGGMQAYQWAVLYPRYMDLAVPIVGTPWLTSADRLTWSIMRLSILDDPAYQGGRYDHEPPTSLANEVDNMFAYTPQYRAQATALASFPAYLAATDGQRSIGANNRIWQINAIDRLDVLEGAGAATLGQRALPRMLIVTSLHDHTVNPAPSLDWAARTHASLLVLDGDCGHMAAVCELPKISAALAAALVNAPPAPERK